MEQYNELPYTNKSPCSNSYQLMTNFVSSVPAHPFNLPSPCIILKEIPDIFQYVPLNGRDALRNRFLITNIQTGNVQNFSCLINVMILFLQFSL